MTQVHDTMLPLQPEVGEIYPEASFITQEDRQWLESLGCRWPEQSEEAGYLADLNELVAIGSETVKYQDDEVRQKVLTARELFLDELSGISRSVHKHSQDRTPWHLPTSTMIETQRAMYRAGINNAKAVKSNPQILSYAPEAVMGKLENLTRLGIDAIRVVNHTPLTLCYSPDAVVAKFDNLKNHGIDAAKVINTFPAALAYAPESVTDKVDNLTAHGLDAAKIFNQSPSVLGLAPESVATKIDNLTKHGIDAAHVINADPFILRYSSTSVTKKLVLLYSAARAWKIEDYRAEVNNIVNRIPTILGVKPTKLRTLIQIASQSLPPQTSLGPISRHVQSAIITNVEAALAGYLEDGNKIKEPADIERVARKYRKISKQLGNGALIDIIAQHPADPAVKTYSRGYPIEHNDV